MIFGVGTDLVVVSRMAELYARLPQRTLEKFLAPTERDDCRSSNDPGRFLAKRLAAKEALGKAFGSGIREPVLMPAIEVAHDALGKPEFRFHGALAEYVATRGITCHLSISDEREHALAFVVVERMEDKQ
ncbi:MAG: holo-ACP synthase [Rhodocyclaceae bacterium]|jgi:holo-[acyl-carrier protein] synthase|nr:holo-ACP synthase [Rhodocyclaceae bacterium]